MKTNETDTTTATATQSTKSTVLLSIDKIRPNPNNPRRSYDENALAELAASIAHARPYSAHPGASRRTRRLYHRSRRTPLPRRATARPDRRSRAIVDAAPPTNGDLRPRALSENIQRGDAVARRGRSLQSRHQPRRVNAAAAARSGKRRAVYYYRMKLNERSLMQKNSARKLLATSGLASVGFRYGKDDLRAARPVAVKVPGGWWSLPCLPERSRPVQARRRKCNTAPICAVCCNPGKRTEPGMSRSENCEFIETGGGAARYKPEIHRYWAVADATTMRRRAL